MKKIFNKRENKGITTMTVVISVIILIILASIGINLSVSENGIIKKSKKIVNGMDYSSQLQANETNRIVTGLEDEGGKYLRTTLLVTPESASKVKEINLKIAVSNKDKVTAKTSNKYQYYVSTSADKLQGGQWLDYKLGTPFTIKNITGKRYVFVKQLTDTYGVVTITKGTTVTIDGVQYQRFGEYGFDNNAPTNTAPQIILASTKTIVIENKQTDDEGQIKTVVYEIKKTTDPDDGWKGQDSGRFENLDENTEYQVRTVSTDEAGNTSESVVVTVRTTGIPGPEAIKSAQNPAGWTNTDRELTISTTVKGYKLETSKDGKNWIKTENQKTYNYGDKVYARLTDGTNFGEQFVFEELQIDKQAPTDTAPIATSTTGSVTVTCTQKDEGSGEDKTKSASGIDTTKTQYRLVTDTTGKTALKDWQNSNVFEGLTHNTTYYVQTQVTDKAGNTRISNVTTLKTQEVPNGNTTGVIILEADHTKWTNTDVVVTAKTNKTGFVIQMSTDGKTFKDGNKVTLTQNGTVYARLRDASNNYGGAASKSISIIDKIAPTNIAPTATATSSSITVTNKQTDVNSRIKTVQYQIKKTSDSTWSSLTSTATFENLLSDTSYDVRTYATDNANNSSYSLVYTISTDSAVWAKSYDTDNDGVGDLLYLSNNKSDTYSTGTVVKDYGDANLKSGFPDWSNDTSFTRVVIGNKIAPKSTFGWFNNQKKLTEINNLKFLDTSKVTNMGYMFRYCSALTTLDVSKFDTSKVTSMDDMFMDCFKLTTLDLSNFDTSNVTVMGYMFMHCSALTSLDVSNFSTSNVINMRNMFYGCGKLTTLDVSNFDTSKVTNMGNMFYGCGKLTTLDVSKFDTSKVTDMRFMFYNCSALTSLDVSKFDTSKVTNMGNMFYGCGKLTTLDVSKFNTSKVTNMLGMFYNCSALTSLDVSKFDTSNVTNMGGMFNSCSALTTLDVSNFDTSNVTNMGSMFNSVKLTTLDLSNFDTSKVTYMGYMFNNCSALTTLDVSNFDTSKVTNMAEMFYGCSKLTTLDVSKFDTSNVIYMLGMFEVCSKLTTLDVSKFDTSKVTSMSYMFRYCSALTTLDVSKFDTSKVTSMDDMFMDCFKLTTLDLSNFDTSKVTNMGYMFSYCSALTSLDVSNFSTSNVINMRNMFCGCGKLITLDLSNFDTSKVTNMGYMFKDCSNLQKIIVSNDNTYNFDVSNVTNSSQMFDSCSKLVGEQGTKYDSNHTDKLYAHIDGGTSNPGYFSKK